MFLGMQDRQRGHLYLELSPVFCEAVRKEIEDINLDGGHLEFQEDMHPFRRSFYCKGNESDIVVLEKFVQRLTAS